MFDLASNRYSIQICFIITPAPFLTPFPTPKFTNCQFNLKLFFAKTCIQFSNLSGLLKNKISQKFADQNLKRDIIA